VRIQVVVRYVFRSGIARRWRTSWIALHRHSSAAISLPTIFSLVDGATTADHFRRIHPLKKSI